MSNKKPVPLTGVRICDMAMAAAEARAIEIRDTLKRLQIVASLSDEAIELIEAVVEGHSCEHCGRNVW